MAGIDAKLSAALASRDARGLRRRLPLPSAPSDASATHDFSSNDYLSLASSPALRSRLLATFAAAPDIAGAGGSRLLVNPRAHAALEARLLAFFHPAGSDGRAALLFNSGFDANAALFAALPQPGDVLLLDALVHASVHDGARASRLPASHRRSFAHNLPEALRAQLLKAHAEVPALGRGEGAVWVAVESVYSMDGTLAPLRAFKDAMDDVFPLGNAHLVVDEAHGTGVLGEAGRGLVCATGMEARVFARLHTFGKALAGSGAVLICSALVRDYLLNYARPLIYTTALPHTAVLAASTALDMLLDGSAAPLISALHANTNYLLTRLRAALAAVPPALIRLPEHLAAESAEGGEQLPPAPIVPLLTPRARALSSFLALRGLAARPIVHPTVPRGAERVRVCVQARTPRAALDALVEGVEAWAGEEVRREREERRREKARVRGRAVGGLLESKL